MSTTPQKLNTTQKKLSDYRLRLREWVEHCKAGYSDPEPDPVAFHLKNNVERFMAIKVREEILGK